MVSKIDRLICAALGHTWVPDYAQADNTVRVIYMTYHCQRCGVEMIDTEF